MAELLPFHSLLPHRLRYRRRSPHLEGGRSAWTATPVRPRSAECSRSFRSPGTSTGGQNFRFGNVLTGWQMQAENASPANLTNDRQLSSESFRVPLCNRKAQPSSADVRGHGLRTTIERFENLGQLRTVNAHTAVCNVDLNVLAVPRALLDFDGNADPALSPAVFDGVGNQVLQTLRKAGQIRHHTR